MGRTELVVTAEEAGTRVDRWLLDRLRTLGLAPSRSELRRVFAERRILRDGSVPNKGEPTQPGARFEVELPDDWGATPDAALPLRIAFEHATAVVVDKPPGVPSAPRRPGELGCVANALVARYPEMRGFGHALLEPGLIHRLDNHTSGLIVAARSPGAFSALTAGIRSGQLEKRYLALVAAPGRVRSAKTHPQALADAGCLQAFIGSGRGARVRCSDVALPRTRPATTRYRVIERGPNSWLLELAVRAAYRHQLRAQLAHVGYPLLGDTLYGAPVHESLSRHALHASFVRWTGSPDVDAFEVESPLPPDLAEVL